jgi:hypothetical protein
MVPLSRRSPLKFIRVDCFLGPVPPANRVVRMEKVVRQSNSPGASLLFNLLITERRQVLASQLPFHAFLGNFALELDEEPPFVGEKLVHDRPAFTVLFNALGTRNRFEVVPSLWWRQAITQYACLQRNSVNRFGDFVAVQQHPNFERRRRYRLLRFGGIHWS